MIGTYEKIFGFDVSVHDAVGVQVRYSGKRLIHECGHLLLSE